MSIRTITTTLTCLFLGLALILTTLATTTSAAPPQQVSSLTSSAKNGDPEAQYNLGLLYEEGRGVEKDFGKALIWYHQAAKQG